VAVYLKASFARYPLHHLGKVTIGKVNYLTATGAYQVVVVSHRPPEQIAATVVPGMHLTDKPQLGKQLQSAINSDQPDARVLLMHPLIYGGWCKVVMTMGDYTQHSLPLGSNFIAPLPQNRDYFLTVIYHLNRLNENDFHLAF